MSKEYKPLWQTIIEQHGGYKKCKEILKNPNIDFIMNAQGLREHMLQYRRQHKIFEPNDLVVFIDEKERKSVLLKFKESRNFDLVHLEIIGSGLCGPSYQKEIRHATDAEIKAGKRL